VALPSRIIADHLIAAGLPVFHLLGPQKTEEAKGRRRAPNWRRRPPL
jgi:hypothetical protein